MRHIQLLMMVEANSNGKGAFLASGSISGRALKLYMAYTGLGGPNVCGTLTRCRKGITGPPQASHGLQSLAQCFAQVLPVARP